MTKRQFFKQLLIFGDDLVLDEKEEYKASTSL